MRYQLLAKLYNPFSRFQRVWLLCSIEQNAGISQCRSGTHVIPLLTMTMSGCLDDILGRTILDAC